MTAKKASIAFIGTGVMGGNMAGHLLTAGHSLTVFTRSRSKAEPLLETGASWAHDPATATGEADFVITMVGDPADVEETYFGPRGVLTAVRPNTVLVDMTTSRADLAQRIARAAEEREAVALDAPVSGGEPGARDAKLSIMVGGSEEAFAKARPLLKLLGTTVVHQGPPGAGQHTKMANQIAAAATMLGMCESMQYATAAGLDPRTVLESITSGAAGSWTLSHLAPRVLQGDFAAGFYVKHFIKDMKIALDSAETLGVCLPGLALARQLYEKLAADGGENEGTQALFRLYSEGKV